MAYINFEVKYWKKHFTKKERDSIRKTFMDITDIDWDKTDYEDLDIAHYFNYYPRPETDIVDNIEGITAKQLRKYVDKYGIKGLKEVLLFLKNPCSKYMDEEHNISWKKVWDKNITPKIGGKNIVQKIREKLNLPDELSFIETPEILGEINSGYLDIDEIMYSLGMWEDYHHRLPKNDMVAIYCVAETFSIKSFNTFKEKVAKKEGCSLFDLSFEKLKSYIVLYNLYKNDVSLQEIDSKLIVALNDKINLDQLSPIGKEFYKYFIENTPFPQASQISQESLKKIDDFLSTMERVYYCDAVVRLFPILAKMPEESISRLEYAIKCINEETKYIPVPLVEAVLKHDSLMQLCETHFLLKNNSIVSTIPKIKKTIDSGWSYKVADKNDPVTAVLGYITNCCMHFGGQGESCLRYGVTKHNSAFLIFYDSRKRVTGFVFLWEFPFNGERVLVYDSVEILGKDITNPSPLALVKESVKEFYTTYRKVICGYDGNISPKGLKDLGEILDSNSKLASAAIQKSMEIGYTDIKDGIILFPNENEIDF